MTHREGEQDGVHFRTERLFSVNNQWYFQTRELSEPLGPYATREAAEKCLRSFLKDVNANLSVAQAVTNLRLLSDSYIEDDY